MASKEVPWKYPTWVKNKDYGPQSQVTCFRFSSVKSLTILTNSGLWRLRALLHVFSTALGTCWTKIGYACPIRIILVFFIRASPNIGRFHANGSKGVLTSIHPLTGVCSNKKLKERHGRTIWAVVWTNGCPHNFGVDTRSRTTRSLWPPLGFLEREKCPKHKKRPESRPEKPWNS